MASTKQPTFYLVFKHHLNMMVSCVRSCMGTVFEGVDCLQTQIISAKCNKCKISASLGNSNHVEIYVVHIKSNKIKIRCNFCNGMFESWNFCGTILYHKTELLVIMKKMASVLLTIGGAGINTLAFSSTNCFFSMLIDNGETQKTWFATWKALKHQQQTEWR